MIKILLLCAGGISTSFLVQKMKAELEKRGKEGEVIADSEMLLDRYIDEVDVILLAPQARYSRDIVQQKCEKKNKAFGVIDMQVYGQMDGESAIDFALSLFDKKAEVDK